MASDDETTVGALRRAVEAFVADRDWQPFHSPKNLAMSVAIEAAELMERFQWLTPQEAEQAVQCPPDREAVADELADVAIYLFSLCNALSLDLTQAMQSKLRLNALRYPAAEFRGRFRKPERDRDGLP